MAQAEDEMTLTDITEFLTNEDSDLEKRISMTHLAFESFKQEMAVLKKDAPKKSFDKVL